MGDFNDLTHPADKRGGRGVGWYTPIPRGFGAVYAFDEVCGFGFCG